MEWLRSALTACFSPPRDASSYPSDRPRAERVSVGNGTATSALKREPMEPKLRPNFDSLASAIARADAEALRTMIFEGANLRVTDRNGTTLLMVAAAYSRVSTDVLELLLKAHVPLNSRDDDGHTAVSWAAVMGCELAIQLLLDAGADFNIRARLGALPLHFAAREGNAMIVNMLLCRKGTAVDAMADARSGHTPLILASMQGHIDVLKVLLEHKADIDRADRANNTALMWAASGGFENAIEFLAEAGADVSSRNSGGFSSIHLAARNGHVQAVLSLIKLGVGVDTKSEGQALTPLMLAASSGHMGLVIELIARGADLDAQDYQGLTALRFAESVGDQPMCRLLVEAKANPLLQSAQAQPHPAETIA